MQENKLNALVSVFWNAFELIGGKAVQVIVLIVLARLLTPEAFGVIGLLVIFTELSKVILDSGFTQTLIREKTVTDIDMCTVFYTNVIVAILIYTLLYVSAPYISGFYNFPELTYYARLLFLTILINSFIIVQNAVLMRDMKFKVLSIRTLLANLFSGAIAIYMAYTGWGVLALIWQQVLAALFSLVLLWVSTRWFPSLYFSFGSLKRLFSFSRHLMLSGMLDAIVSNIQSVLIGKFYTPTQLGFYTQSKQLSTIPSQTLTSIIRNVSYPAFTKLKSEGHLKSAYTKVIKLTLFFVFPLMIGLAVIGNNLIPLLLGEKWVESVKYFQIFCVAGAIYPLYVINQNIFLVVGDSKAYLNVSLIKRAVTLTIVLLTVKFGVLAMVYGYLAASIINVGVVMLLSGKKINYGMFEQIKDLLGIFITTVLMVVIVVTIKVFISFNTELLSIVIQILVGLVSFFGLSFAFKLNEIEELKVIVNSIAGARK